MALMWRYCNVLCAMFAAAPAVVVAAPLQYFGESPVNMTCPHCNASIITATTYDTGLLTWLAAGGICLVGWVCWEKTTLEAKLLRAIADDVYANLNNRKHARETRTKALPRGQIALDRHRSDIEWTWHCRIGFYNQYWCLTAKALDWHRLWVKC